MEHDHGVRLDVAHVDLLQHLLLLGAQLAELGKDLRLQEVLVAVVGVVGGLEGLVVEPVTSHPLVDAALRERRAGRHSVSRIMQIPRE